MLLARPAVSLLLTLCAFSLNSVQAATLSPESRAFLEERCLDCHDSDTKKGGVDLEKLLSGAGVDDAGFATWVRVHDAVERGEMPPKKRTAPAVEERAAFTGTLAQVLTSHEAAARQANGRATFRRLNRTEYENTLRDLFDLPGLAVRDLLPEDGRADGYDKVGGALDLSHVQLAKYLEAAEKALSTAVATQPERPPLFKQRLWPGDQYMIKIAMTSGDCVALKDFRYDPAIRPEPPGEKQGKEKTLRDYEQEKLFPYEGTVGFFRHDDDAFHGDFARFSPIAPGLYRIRISVWSFLWDKGEVLPSPRTEVCSLNASPRGVLGYFDAPSLKPTEHETVVWLNRGEQIVFNAASLVPRRIGEEKGRLAAATSQGIALDWLEVEGPLLDAWPASAHRMLFGDLPLASFDKKGSVKQPPRTPQGQRAPSSWPNYKVDYPGQPLFTVASAAPDQDVTKLLSTFLPKAFRHPVAPAEVERYAAFARGRMSAGVSFEEAMRDAYKAALCSPDFLYLHEPQGPLDDYALASRLSYFLWDSTPDEELLRLAGEGRLHESGTLHEQTERLLHNPKAERFVADFTDQWLDVRDLDLTSPDKKLYPEFREILHDAMPRETRAYFRELLEKDLPAVRIVHSDFAMLNQRLAELYGLPGVAGDAIRRVELPPDSHRGGFLTQAAILKVTANGTTTSPVKRGAWVMRRILGEPPQPPPPAVPAIEPDVTGATTVRAQLERHRADATCAGCHARIDPPGFALESYDVIGGFRTRYRSLEKGDSAPLPPGARFVSFKLAQPVECAGKLVDGRTFDDLAGLQQLLLDREPQLARNLASQLITYATGAAPGFSDRTELQRILSATEEAKHGVRSLVHAVIQSSLFRTK